MSSNIPKLRFAGFSGEWEDGLIGSKFDFISTNSLSRENLNYVKGSVKNIHYGDIHTIFRPLFDVTRENVPFINTNCVPNRITTNNYLQKGDVLFADASEDYNEIGKCIEVINTNNEKIVAGLHTIHARAKDSDEFHPGFLAPLLRTNSIHKQIRVIAQGIKVLSISPTSLGTVVLYRPKKKEQKKIADFLSAVDSRIEGLETMMDLQKRYKQGVMQRIFNQTIRFKDDNGKPFPDWQETILGDLCNITTGKLDANHAKDDGCYRFYTCAKDFLKIDKYAFDTEALLISGNGAYVGYVHYYKGKFNAYQRTYVLDNFYVNIFFVKYYLDRFLQRRIMAERKEGNTPYIVLSTLSGMPILLPNKDEQEKIADFLSDLDTKIEATQKQLDAAREWKKGLLQKMFV